MPLSMIDEREALLAMRIARREEPGDNPPDVEYVNGREAREWEKPHLAAGVRQQRAEGIAAVAGTMGSPR